MLSSLDVALADPILTVDLTILNLSDKVITIYSSKGTGQLHLNDLANKILIQPMNSVTVHPTLEDCYRCSILGSMDIKMNKYFMCPPI